jgi:formylglycine-generating enzyme
VMVWVSAGEFTMGSNPTEISRMWKKFGWKEDWKQYTKGESPKHRVHLDGYWIYKHEVTVAQYRKFCAETGHQMPNEPFWVWYDDHPIVSVNWYDAAKYCQWAGVALPTEAQWEKAARGTDGRIFPWGNEWDSRRCNGTYPGIGRTTPVGSYPDGASPYGIMDMAGNVWEWCMDEYDEEFYDKNESRTNNPVSGGLINFKSNRFKNLNSMRVVRGGSWRYAPSVSRAAVRGGNNPGLRNYTRGFRGSSASFP